MLVYKLWRHMLQLQINRLNLALHLHMVKDYFYIKAFLFKIELTKQLLTLELEQGQEVLIPRQLA